MTRRRWIALAVATPIVLLLSTFRTDLDPAELEARWAPPPSRFVDALGVRVHVRIEGSGPPLVLLHGDQVRGVRPLLKRANLPPTMP